MSSVVHVRQGLIALPTYEPSRPDPSPMFLEKRVYQGSSGRVYPLPCTDRIASEPTSRTWKAVFIENEYVRVMLLPELGGRIHRILDKTNNYDAIYYQAAIKPALVGLTGPWCSGGIEFNWPQHHRPSTFMPADVAIERDPDGAATVWMSEHDPVARMKGMHGVRLRPGKSLIELRVRAYNRTTDVQTFLWWANVAARVHEGYQSFFPPDARYVADHARRAMTTFPHANGQYYGVDYAERAISGVPAAERPHQYEAANSSGVAAPGIPSYRPDDLSWYANIPVPTSYMCVGSSEDFAGGYDFKAQAGLLHIANHHIAPGKKQWTWGNHEFGYAWDRNLTDADEDGEFRPYIELMTGVYTDNQPDFSFLHPGETKTWSQFWYPFRAIGPACCANTDVAISLRAETGTIAVGVAVTAPHERAMVQLRWHGKVVARWRASLAPDRPATFRHLSGKPGLRGGKNLAVRVASGAGKTLLEYQPKPAAATDMPAAATEPAMPREVRSTDELYHIGLHLEQYRHATRMPEGYWREALRRDPEDARCNLALGRWHLRRGEFPAAETHLRRSIARAVARNPNPYDGEAHYQLGICLRHRFLSGADRAAEVTTADRSNEALLAQAYAAFYKATWNHAWQAAGFHALAEIDCWRGDWSTALEHLQRARRLNADNLRARNLEAIVLRRLGREKEAETLLAESLALDPLDWWARHLSGQALRCDNQVRIDLALDCARAGLLGDGLKILSGAVAANPDRPDGSLGTEPLVHYTRGWLTRLQGGRRSRTARHLLRAIRASGDYCFPFRLEEIAILECALDANPADHRAAFLLGNLLYDRRRHREAIALWEKTVRLAPGNAIAWRNLGIAYLNICREPKRARFAYNRAVAADPRCARFVYERDQLWKRLGDQPAKRLRALRRFARLIPARDDLSIEYCGLCNQVGDHQTALDILASRRFQPWEGGEGRALAQHERTHLAFGRQALVRGNFRSAVDWFRRALAVPENLGEARHLLANRSNIHYWLGCALAAAGEAGEAKLHWQLAADFRGDFQGMSLRSHSEMTWYSALSLEKLERKREAARLLRDLLRYARRLRQARATIDYFATSLPTMLLFDDDLERRQETHALLLMGQAQLGLGQRDAGRRYLRQVLERDPSHDLAADLLSP